MINIVICDDNKDTVSMIQNLIIKFMDLNIFLYEMNTYNSGEDMLKSGCKCDVIFLDIIMNGKNGIQMGIILRNLYRNIKIIYISNFDQYMVQALNCVHAFAYLKKPIVMKDIETQMKDVLQIAENKNLGNLRIKVIKINDRYNIDTVKMDFDINDIYYFEYVNRRIKIKTKHGKYYFESQMKNMVEAMQAYSFENCHRNFLVNLNYVQKVKGYELLLHNGERLPVAQKKSSKFRKKLNEFIQKNN